MQEFVSWAPLGAKRLEPFTKLQQIIESSETWKTESASLATQINTDLSNTSFNIFSKPNSSKLEEYMQSILTQYVKSNKLAPDLWTLQMLQNLYF